MALKILFITGSFPPDIGGIQTYIYNLCKYSRHNITVLAPDTADSESFDKEQSLRIVRASFLNQSFLRSGLGLLRKVIGLVRNENFDLIICNHVLVSTVGRAIRLFTKKPFVVITYGKDTLEYLDNFLLNRLVRGNLRQAAGVVTCSEYTKGEVMRLGVEEGKTYAVVPGVDSKFVPASKNEVLLKKHKLQGHKILYTIGRLVERKGHDMVLYALPEILVTIPNLKYLIVGGGEYRDTLEAIVRDLKLEDYVVFAGQVADNQLLDYYNLGDVFIMPSRYVENTGSVEGFGIVYLEAASCEKVVIGGNSGGAPEAVGDESTGILVDPIDSHAVAQAVVKVFRHPDYAKRLAFNARNRANRYFTHEARGRYFDEVIVRSVKFNKYIEGGANE